MEEKETIIAPLEGLDEVAEISTSDFEKEGETGEHRHHHHHHHHRHHRHSGSHRRDKRNKAKKDNKVVKFFKRYRSILINIVACSISVVLLILLASRHDKTPDSQVTNENDVIGITQATVEVESSVYLSKVPLVSQAILSYLDGSNDLTVRETYKMYGGDTQKLNIGMPLRYTYRMRGLPSGTAVEKAVLELSENEEFDGVLSYELDAGNDDIEIYHLKPDTKYYYKLKLTLSGDTVIGSTGDFTTVASPRILNIDGAVNVRDIGGWEAEGGKKIKYGLLYRGSELDGAVEPTYLLTEQGLDDMISVLGIRFDMDLRGENESDADPLGANVTHKFYGVSMYSYLFGDDGEKVRSVFSDLADKDNYPIYMHCTYGLDRTGTICYLLEALLGVSDKDLRTEYDLSAFKDGYVNTEEFTAFITRIAMLEGNTTKEKVENYLLSVGVTAEQIASIRNIFLGE